MGYRLIFSEVFKYLPALLKGLGFSIIISAIGMLLGSFIGVFVGRGRTSSVRIVRIPVNVYIEIFRNTPLLIQMYLFYFGLAQFNIHLSPFVGATLALILNVGAYTAVIFQTGFNAIQKDQKEAAYALGMNHYQVFFLIIFPQALRIVIPPLTNQFISVFLFSSVASVISVPELTYITMNIESITMRTFEIFITTTALYLIVTTCIAIFSRFYEKRYKY